MRGRGCGITRWRLGRSAGLFAAVALLASSLTSGPAVANPPRDVEDLLWDLQIIPLTGEPAPVTLRGLDGQHHSLANLKGHVVLLYFWATW